MITLKVQLKNSLEYLMAIQPKDNEDLAKKNAVISVLVRTLCKCDKCGANTDGVTKVHLMGWEGTHDELLEHLKKEGGIISEQSATSI